MGPPSSVGGNQENGSTQIAAFASYYGRMAFQHIDNFIKAMTRNGDDLPRVALVSGYGGSGKDAAAELLVNRYGYKRLEFSAPIQQRILEENAVFEGRHARDIVDEIGWTAAKKDVPGFVQRMIDIGNDMRATRGPNALTDILREQIEANPRGRYVITGPRTEHESRFAESFGGMHIRVDRPGVKPRNEGENIIDDFEPDVRIHNRGTLEDLHMNVENSLRNRQFLRGLPPVEEGKMRLFRGEGPHTAEAAAAAKHSGGGISANTGAWYTNDINIAKNYSDSIAGGRLIYQDVTPGTPGIEVEPVRKQNPWHKRIYRMDPALQVNSQPVPDQDLPPLRRRKRPPPPPQLNPFGSGHSSARRGLPVRSSAPGSGILR